MGVYSKYRAEMGMFNIFNRRDGLTPFQLRDYVMHGGLLKVLNDFAWRAGCSIS